MTRRSAVAVCTACAVLHLVPPVALGAFDGDYGLLVLGGPLAGATALAAAALSTGGTLGRLVAVVLAAVVAALSWLLIVAYGYGFLHLPQAVVAVGVAATTRPDAR